MDTELLYCYNKGCGAKFNPKENSSEACVYHPGPPYFHDAYKIWSCCGKKSTDFGTWLGFKGCTRGAHNGVKPADDDTTAKPIRTETKIRPEAAEEVIVWNGLNKAAPRGTADNVQTVISMVPTEAALNAIEKRRREVDQGDGASSSVVVGMLCRNPGCDKSFRGPESDKEVCVFHSGTAIFHEGMKFWSCCQRKTSNFSAFLEQKGCTTGSHQWSSKRESVGKVREDWFCRSGFIHLNVYCKGALPSESLVQSDGLILTARVVHGFGRNETVLRYELFRAIDVSRSKVIVGERKLEMVLKQKEETSWPRLTYDPDVDQEAQGGSNPEGAVVDSSSGTSPTVF